MTNAVLLSLSGCKQDNVWMSGNEPARQPDMPMEYERNAISDVATAIKPAVSVRRRLSPSVAER